MSHEQAPITTAWWQSTTVWLVIGFTAAALLACAATIWIALQDSDAPPPAMSSANGPPTLTPTLTPAMQARNAVADQGALFQRNGKD